MKKVSFYSVVLLYAVSFYAPAFGNANTSPYDELKPGDLLFFWTSEKVRHVGIYLEDGLFFHSSTSEGVTVGDLNENYWRWRLISIRRVRHAISLDDLKRAYARYDQARYGYGHEGPDRFDCSGLVWRVFKEHGVELPRSTRYQIRTGALVISGRNYLLKYRN